MNEIETTENEDGSLNISVELTESEIRVFAELGLRFSIIRACIDITASDEEIIRWGILGKEHFKEKVG